jgi:hypothetical protein
MAADYFNGVGVDMIGGLIGMFTGKLQHKQSLNCL